MRDEMVNSRAKGIGAERAVANYLIFCDPVLWSGARRKVASGWSNGKTEYQDEGDVAGTPGLCFQVKNMARPLVGRLLDDIWSDTRAQALRGNRVPIIIEKRAGCADVGQWWAHLDNRFYVELLTGAPRLVMADLHLVRVAFRDIVRPLRLWSRAKVADQTR